MPEKRTLLNSESLQTVIAVCFVLALLSVTFNFYNFNRLNNLQSFMAMLNNHNITGMQAQLNALDEEIEEANNRLEDVQDQLDEQKKALAEALAEAEAEE